VDLHRTITNCEEFKLAPDSGKNRLYNVLHAYSAVDPEVGYSQGMNFLAAMLLLNIPDEEDAFWCLVSIMMPSKGQSPKMLKGRHNWRRMFTPDMQGIQD
jgi:hypothetical protein